ncbi:hypothetical protein N7456_004593 [Penicillium angulare]|uniref:Uncharacterized protein n=1 Tax=Penicillium angulare TaxID=116970 RepID=A0A9W9FWU8_9EURO|nr:hypothetical protein N7456_004593 [Penicillium angulare]
MQGVSYRMWRYHFGAISKIIDLRGGIHELAKSGGGESMVFTYFLFAVMGDTTSPVSDLFMTPEHYEEHKAILDQYSSDVPLFRMFPKELLAHTLKVNLIRAQWAQSDLATPAEFTQDALMTLGCILEFSPANWAYLKSGLYHGDQFLLGTIHQAAVTLYCVCSLQSLFILPHTQFLTRLRIEMTASLFESLTKALQFQKFRKLLFWPLVVLGMAAVDSDESVRAFVLEHLGRVSRSIGLYAPVVAKNVIRRFWASGMILWDDCFREPYIFVHYGGQGLDLKNMTA